MGMALCAPTSNDSSITESKESDRLTIKQDFFIDEFKVYSAEHDIVQILVPLNALNFDDDEDDESGDDDSEEAYIFFVEADVKDGVKEYKGVSVIKNKQAKKILETGTDAAAANDDTKTAYFSATDGIYSYNVEKNTAEKYGTVTDNLISIAKVNGSDVIYVLNDKFELFKVTEEGTKKEKIDAVVGAQQIVLDYANNLYYYNADKQAFVYNDEGVKKIEGLPDSPSYINLLKPPFVIEEGIPVVIDNSSYLIFVNGTSTITDFDFVVKPTAYAMEATLIQYFAHDKNIYEYNILAILFSTFLEEIREFLNDKTEDIQAIATRGRGDLKA